MLLLLLSPHGTENAARADAAIQATPAQTPDAPAIQMLAAGEGDTAQLSYAFDPDENTVFKLSIVQTMSLEGPELKTEVHTSISSSARIIASREDKQQLFISFEDFAIQVRADEQEVSIPALDTLLRGLKVHLRADPRLAFTDDSMSVSVNPQVQRMISLLVDALRQSHPTLPEEAVALHARWSNESAWQAPEQSGLALTLSRSFELTALSPASASIQAQLSLRDPTGRIQGSGQLSSTISRELMQLTKANMDFELVLSSDAPNDPTQTIALSFSLERVD
ncbi:MAG: hypothetical protein RBU37_11000 [Myxococcota bacterium]|nr:hypothetical protein [Myxococcota bacterium]